MDQNLVDQRRRPCPPAGTPSPPALPLRGGGGSAAPRAISPLSRRSGRGVGGGGCAARLRAFHPLPPPSPSEGEGARLSLTKDLSPLPPQRGRGWGRGARARHTRRLPLLLVLFAGTALRLFRLGADSLWYDETVSTFLAGSPLPELIRHTAGDIHPPGYYALLRGWLILTGYPTGHAAPSGNGLEFAAGFFSLAAGLALIALVYVLARRFVGPKASVLAAALVAASPYNVWYGQEVRMYTLGAGLGVLAFYALLRALGQSTPNSASEANCSRPSLVAWWAVYAVAAAAGLYTLYYFAFLLIALNVWALIWLAARWARSGGRALVAWLLANLGTLLLYAPWLPVAWRQATDPPVPPWRTAAALLPALAQSWTALALGQSAPGWLWPVLAACVAVYALGLAVTSRGQWTLGRLPVTILTHPLAWATFGALGLVLAASAVTPLYHVRYVFTYSPAFYVALAAGLGWLWSRRRTVALVAAAAWLAAAAVTLVAFWNDPAFRADDHRAAVRYLQAHWRPGDVVVVNAGYAYTALLTYWNGPVASQGRITAPLPSPRTDAALVMVTTGHVDGGPGLGWADPRSDFFALPATVARQQMAGLFAAFPRVWQYRVYDTVNDPGGLVRAALAEDGQPFTDQVFTGEANLRVQGFVPRDGAADAAAARSLPAASLGGGLAVHAAAIPTQAAAGGTLYPQVYWQKSADSQAGVATSVRLVDGESTIWAQPDDERPLGPAFEAPSWPTGRTVRQALALPIPLGTPPGRYTVELVAYDPASGQPLTAAAAPGGLPPSGSGVSLGQVDVVRPAATAPRPAVAAFGPLALVSASSPATEVGAGGQVPVAILWQALRPPQEPLVVVLQLLDAGGRVAAGLEAQPLDGRYPCQDWAAGELVADRHALSLPSDLPAGTYRLVLGVYRTSDRTRLTTRAGLFTSSDHYAIKSIIVR